MQQPAIGRDLDEQIHLLLGMEPQGKRVPSYSTNRCRALKAAEEVALIVNVNLSLLMYGNGEFGAQIGRAPVGMHTTSSGALALAIWEAIRHYGI